MIWGFPELKGMFVYLDLPCICPIILEPMQILATSWGKDFTAWISSMTKRPYLFWASYLAIYLTLSTTKPHQTNPWKRKMIWFFSVMIWNKWPLLTRPETQQSKEITLMDNLFPPKITENNMFPQAEVEKEEAETQAPLRHPHTCWTRRRTSYAWGGRCKISSTSLSVSGFSEGGSLNLERLLKYFLVQSKDLQHHPT